MNQHLAKIFLISFLIFGAQIQAQQPIYDTWKAYMSYLEMNQIALNDDEILCATENGMFSFNVSDYSITTYSKTTGLSDIGVDAIAALNGKIFLAYDNLNIDIMENGLVTNIPAIKNSNISGEKKIFRIVPTEHFAYICGTFGIAVLEVENGLINETYSLTDGSEQVFVNDITFGNNLIAAATNKGVFFADASNPNLFDLDEWDLHNGNQNLPFGASIKQIEYFENTFYALADSQVLFLKEDGSWQNFYNTAENWGIRSFTFGSNNELITAERKFENGSLADANLAITNDNQTLNNESYSISFPENVIEKDGIIYIADRYRGLVKITAEDVKEILPNRPNSHFNFDMDIGENGELWVASGAATASYNDAVGFGFGVYTFDGFTWQNYNKYNLYKDEIEDVISVDINNITGEVVFGTSIYGLQIFTDDGYQLIDTYNSTLEERNTNDTFGWIRVFDTAFDNDGNLWVANSEANTLIKMRSKEGEWYSLNSNQNITGLYPKMIHTSFNQIWLIHLRNGILVYDYGNDIYSSGDDSYKRIKTGAGTGGLPELNVLCLAEDKDGEIWVGTDKGISIFFCAPSIFTNGCDGFEPIVDINGILGPLLQDDAINDIEVDNANRKWVATSNGVWLLSDDGETVIKNFTKNNSPLLSNNVKSVEINNITGEVFFGTDKGIISYVSDATRGSNDFSSVNIYPNPVKPNYNGLITIENLIENCDVKITDINGTLVHETTALGGKIQWNGKDYTGRKVQSGVYLIFANTGFSGESYEGKMMILH